MFKASLIALALASQDVPAQPTLEWYQPSQ
ncbi:MAG: hypothetical protein ACI9HE_002519, partial [Planctomycetota bacterium]